MTRHVASTRDFGYAAISPYSAATARRMDLQGPRPCSGGALRITAPLPVGGASGQPYLGMDPSAPATWVRPWNPQPGMIALLNFDGAKAQGDTPTGGVARGAQRDRWLPRRVSLRMGGPR